MKLSEEPDPRIEEFRQSLSFLENEFKKIEPLQIPLDNIPTMEELLQDLPEEMKNSELLKHKLEKKKTLEEYE